MRSYEAPSITEIASVADLTRGDFFQPGTDGLSWIPIIGGFFGDGSGS